MEESIEVEHNLTGEESTKKKAQKRENNLTRKKEGDSTGEAWERDTHTHTHTEFGLQWD